MNDRELAERAARKKAEMEKAAATKKPVGVKVPTFETERGPKWCPECKTPYEGNRIKFNPDIPPEEQYTPIPQKVDTEDRVVALCDPCVDKWEKEMLDDGHIAPPTPRDKVQSQVPDNLEFPGEPKE